MDDKKFSAAVDLLAESWRLAHFTEKFADGADDKLRKKNFQSSYALRQAFSRGGRGFRFGGR